METGELTTYRSHRTTRRVLTAVLAAFTLTGGITAAEAVPRAQGVEELPPVTISSTTLRAGETVTISGTGCVDPDTGSGEGLEVALLVPVDMGRGGVSPIRPVVRAPAEADGTFEGSGVMEQPLFPNGAQTGIFSCQEQSEDGFPPVVAQREVELTIEAPSLPDLTVAAGSTFDYTLPCTITGGDYGRFSIVPDGQEEFAFFASGSFPYETSPQEGDTVSLEVSPDLVPGTYDATASCSISQSGPSAYFSGFTVTVTGADTPTPDPTPTAPEAATPVAGAPDFTG